MVNRPRTLLAAVALLLFAAVAAAQDRLTTSGVVFKYMSTNAPACSGELSRSLISLSARNHNVYAQCVAASQQYSLFPYSGFLPTDAQLVAMVSSLACLEFFQAVLALPLLRECNLGGLDVKSVLETLLMTSQDVVKHVEPLTASQFVQFITWRHARNIAQESGEPYDAASDSAVAFDTQVVEAAARLQVTLTAQLEIQVERKTIGSAAGNDGEVAGDSEIRSTDDAASQAGSVSPSTGEKTTTSTGSETAAKPTSAASRAASGWALAAALGLSCLLAQWP